MGNEDSITVVIEENPELAFEAHLLDANISPKWVAEGAREVEGSQPLDPSTFGPARERARIAHMLTNGPFRGGAK